MSSRPTLCSAGMFCYYCCRDRRNFVKQVDTVDRLKTGDGSVTFCRVSLFWNVFFSSGYINWMSKAKSTLNHYILMFLCELIEKQFSSCANCPLFIKNKLIVELMKMNLDIASGYCGVGMSKTNVKQKCDEIFPEFDSLGGNGIK